MSGTLKFITAFFLLATVIAGCQKTTITSGPPKISDLLVASNILHTTPDLNDSFRLGFHFSDGDADISNASITLLDLLDTTHTPYLFPLPAINTADINLPDGANGSILLQLSSGEMLFQQYDSTQNKKVLRIFMTDNAGKRSNALQTDTIFLVP